MFDERNNVEVRGDGGQGIYLYCLALRNALPPIEEPGLDERFPVFPLALDDIVAVVSHVGLAAWTGPASETHLKSLAWLAPRVCRHEKVIEQVMRHSAVLPARFGTFFSSPAELGRLVQANHDAILQFLLRVADKAECAVKGLLDKASAVEQLLARDPRASTFPTSSGAGYLMKQRLRDEIRKELAFWTKTTGEAIVMELRRHAVDSRPLPVLSPEASGRDGEMVFNWAFLLARDGWKRFEAQVERLGTIFGDAGLILEISGPWPAYSFCPSLQPAPSPTSAHFSRC